ncbi:MAG: pyridoxal phosphate-dependent aminotransferase [Clostridia bacterium]|nr:pyridoxal phosphate-dependent aminotransferase [Clostridia bacterium]
MESIQRADKMKLVHSDIRGPVFEEANRMRKNGIDVLRLNTGNPGVFGFGLPESVRSAIADHLDQAVPYCDLRGMPAARSAICEYHKTKNLPNINEEDIFIGNGVSELVTMALLPLLNSGDEMLIPSPDYSLWTNSVYIAGGTPVHYICDEKSNWYPDIEDIKSKITPKTKAILVINPNNPTGAVYPDEILMQIAQIAREHDLIVFSDEIYDRLVMDGLKHTSLGVYCPDLFTITFNGLSKSHIVCGYRCGWMIISGNKEKGKDYIAGIQQIAAMRLCANAIMQLAIPAALADFESTNAMMVPGGRLYEQREACCKVLDTIEGLSYVKNHAAFYIFPKLDVKRFNITDDNQFAFDFLHEKHVMIIPGRGFSWKQPDHFRIVMLPRADQLADAMEKLKDFLATYRQA